MNEDVRVDADRELLAIEFLPALVPPGRYTVQSVELDVQKMFDRRTLVLRCQIVEPPQHDGVELCWYAPLPPEDLRRVRPSPATKFLKAWILVMGQRPGRGKYPAHRVLLHKRFVAIVETVKFSSERDEHRKPVPLPKAAQYSVIRSLVDMA